MYLINKKFWNKKKVFVTGHTGFKGSWLCIILNHLGAEVTGYSLSPSTSPNLFNLANVGKIIKKSVIADVRNYNKLLHEIKKSKSTIIFHLAAQPLVRHSYEEPKKTFDTNFVGSLNILECVRKIKTVVSTIIITSDKVYDVSKNKIYNEKDDLSGKDPYSASKVCIEFLFSSYTNSFFSSQKNQRLATVRAGNVIGGGDYSRDRLIPDVYAFLKKKNKIIIRSPNAVRPWQHVLEPLSGYLLLAEKIHSKKLLKILPNWNFGPDIKNCKTVKYVSNYLAKNLKLKIVNKNKKSKKYKPETKILRLNNLKAKKYLNWRPKWGLNKSLNKILEWNNNIKIEKPLDVCLKQIREFLQK